LNPPKRLKPWLDDGPKRLPAAGAGDGANEPKRLPPAAPLFPNNPPPPNADAAPASGTDFAIKLSGGGNSGILPKENAYASYA
jgi:hypothetical protein